MLWEGFFSFLFFEDSKIWNDDKLTYITNDEKRCVIPIILQWNPNNSQQSEKAAGKNIAAQTIQHTAFQLSARLNSEFKFKCCIMCYGVEMFNLNIRSIHLVPFVKYGDFGVIYFSYISIPIQINLFIFIYFYTLIFFKLVIQN